MKTHVLISFALGACCSAYAAPFINLDFEMVNTNTSTLFDEGNGFYFRGFGPIEDLMPGWDLTCEDGQITEIGYNSEGSPTQVYGVGVISRDAYPDFNIYAKGNHTLYIGFFGVDTSGTYVLSQMGDIPVGAVQYAIEGALGTFTPLELRLNGFLIGRDRDISAFQGQKDVEMEFTIFDPRSSGIPSDPYGTFIDTISFVVPEPSTDLLFLVGGLAMGWFLCRGRWK